MRRFCGSAAQGRARIGKDDPSVLIGTHAEENEAPRAKTARPAVWFLVRLSVGIALIAYLARSRIIDFHSLLKPIAAWPIDLAAVSLIFLDVVLMAARLSMLFKPQGLQLSFANSLKLTLVSSFFATFLPGAAGGDLAKLFYAAKENKGRRAEIVTVVIFDRAIGLFSILILPLLFAPLFRPLIRDVAVLRMLLIAAVILALCMLAGLILCLRSPAALSRLLEWGFRFLPGKKLAERSIASVAAYRGHARVLVAALGLSLLANLTLIGATALAIWALHPASMSMKMCLVIPLGDLANNLPLTPGGLGVGESAYSVLFKLAGLEGGAEALLCWRIWRAAVGLLGLILYLRGPGRSVYGSETGAGESGTA
jgi:glycosyltransferase 2 family protein